MSPFYILQSLNMGKEGVRTHSTHGVSIPRRRAIQASAQVSKEIGHWIRRLTWTRFSVNSHWINIEKTLKLGHLFNLRDFQRNLGSWRIFWYICGRQIDAWVLLVVWAALEGNARLEWRQVTFGNFYRDGA